MPIEEFKPKIIPAGADQENPGELIVPKKGSGNKAGLSVPEAKEIIVRNRGGWETEAEANKEITIDIKDVLGSAPPPETTMERVYSSVEALLSSFTDPEEKGKARAFFEQFSAFSHEHQYPACDREHDRMPALQAFDPPEPARFASFFRSVADTLL
ncbi:hypothetical protein L0Y46_00060, partial [bacterium]|nr:hypothetical protein [bacterium]